MQKLTYRPLDLIKILGQKAVETESESECGVGNLNWRTSQGLSNIYLTEAKKESLISDRTALICRTRSSVGNNAPGNKQLKNTSNART